MPTKEIQKLIERLNIVVADQKQHARKLTRMMLMNTGAKSIYEAGDGVAALDTIRTANPDVAILEWELPLVSGQISYELFDRQVYFRSLTCQSSCSWLALIARA